MIMCHDFKTIYFSRFAFDIHSHGGCRRAAQIYRALEPFKPQFLSYAQVPSILTAWKGWLVKFTNRGWSSEIQHALFARENASYYWSKQIDSAPCLAVLDDPIFFNSLFRRLKRMKEVFLVAICHNIESLCEGQVAYGFQKKLLKKEVARLSACDLVVTISEEDTALLKKYGVNTFYYPYYPVDEIAADLLKIRQSRSNCSKHDFILLGTCYNFPTRNAMRELIGVWKTFSFLPGADKLLVAGFGTESLREQCRGEHIEFLGSISAEELTRRLSTVKACLCYRISKTGTLTRVVEMRIAGVPVIINADGAGSHRGETGVLTFRNWDELHELLSTFGYTGEISLPASPAPHELFELIERGLYNKRKGKRSKK